MKRVSLQTGESSCHMGKLERRCCGGQWSLHWFRPTASTSVDNSSRTERQCSIPDGEEPAVLFGYLPFYWHYWEDTRQKLHCSAKSRSFLFRYKTSSFLVLKTFWKGVGLLFFFIFWINSIDANQSVELIIDLHR